ncbi:MAG: hypothetical protein CVV46_06715 [Spirochaetae bacterium HGW-Spirochaetae-2]|nr:MAG: hypothetical protein CVV46_06715 [Spirochaetae bacterium HGW-Spirochaetae-2]
MFGNLQLLVQQQGRRTGNRIADLIPGIGQLLLQGGNALQNRFGWHRQAASDSIDKFPVPTDQCHTAFSGCPKSPHMATDPFRTQELNRDQFRRVGDVYASAGNGIVLSNPDNPYLPVDFHRPS